MSSRRHPSYLAQSVYRLESFTMAHTATSFYWTIRPLTLYIYSQTFGIQNEYQLVREGLRADAILGQGSAWLGGGVTWDTPQDLSNWTTMHVSLWSENQDYNSLQIEFEAGAILRVSIADYGFVADGEWARTNDTTWRPRRPWCRFDLGDPPLCT